MGNYSLDHHFCDKSCESEFKSSEWVGENHPTYRGWSNEFGYGPNWREIRQEVLERDNYKCVECGISDDQHTQTFGMSLHIHHKTPLREFELAEEANNLDNLQTLCVVCHGRKD